jgi:hypothetical protein
VLLDWCIVVGLAPPASTIKRLALKFEYEDTYRPGEIEGKTDWLVKVDLAHRASLAVLMVEAGVLFA